MKKSFVLSLTAAILLVTSAVGAEPLVPQQFAALLSSKTLPNMTPIQKVQYYWGGCGQRCGDSMCASNERPQFETATGRCWRCSSQSGQSC